MKRLIMICALSCILLTNAASADMGTFADRTVFEAQTSVVYSYGFEDWRSDFSYPSNSYTRDGVTYTTGNNLVVGTGTIYNSISNVFYYRNWTPITTTIDNTPDFTMFGLDVGCINVPSSDLIDLAVYTNLGSYLYLDLDVPNANTVLDFYGFAATGGEFFIGF